MGLHTVWHTTQTSGRLDLSRSVSHVVPLEDVAQGVDRLCTSATSRALDNLSGSLFETEV